MSTEPVGHRAGAQIEPDASGRVALYAASLSAAGCAGALSILVLWTVRLFVSGPPNAWAIRTPQPVSASAVVALACLFLWAGAALVGLVAGLLARSEAGRAGLRWSVALLCSLILVPFLLSIMPKS